MVFEGPCKENMPLFTKEASFLMILTWRSKHGTDPNVVVSTGKFTSKPSFYHFGTRVE
jgi:hypothetical protein